MRWQINIQYLRCGWPIAIESDEIGIFLLSIPFWTIPNIQFTFFFFLVASEPWTDVFIQDSLHSHNSQLKAHHFIMNLGAVSPHMHHFLFIYTEFHLSFYCPATQPHKDLLQLLTIPTVKSQQEASGFIFSGKVSRDWAVQGDSSLGKVGWISCL